CQVRGLTKKNPLSDFKCGVNHKNQEERFAHWVMVKWLTPPKWLQLRVPDCCSGNLGRGTLQAWINGKILLDD
ncbi:MAG: hypothetical protein PVJ54_14740, partial [Desulfobacterales bacterium]